MFEYIKFWLAKEFSQLLLVVAIIAVVIAVIFVCVYARAAWSWLSRRKLRPTRSTIQAVLGLVCLAASLWLSYRQGVVTERRRWQHIYSCTYDNKTNTQRCWADGIIRLKIN